MSKPWPWWGAPALLGIILWIHGATLGLSDDEAYYWVLSRRPALGYAFHPPAVAWILAGFQKVLGGVLGESSPALIRLPAALMASIVMALGLLWVRSARVRQSDSQEHDSALFSSDAVIAAALAGVFGIAWMMVPDLPLFCGWAILFYSSFEVALGRDGMGLRTALVFGAAISVLSKFSGVLAVGSAGLVILLGSSRKVFLRSVILLGLGALIGFLPTLVWNSQHEWGSLLYQFRERHGGAGISWLRYGRFWALQIVLAGPALIWFSLRASRSWKDPAIRHALLWSLPPALVYCIQPLFSEFKPHWALIVWLPMAFALALEKKKYPIAVRVHVVYGLGLALVVGLASHIAILPVERPTHDVSNDLYGWSELSSRLARHPILPVVGSRYQTASQAAAALHGSHAVTMIPRDLKQMDEWPDLEISDSQGPSWPRLLKPVYFVADNRYSQAPDFRSATCKSVESIRATRGSRVAKEIYVWRCDPIFGSDQRP